MNRTAKEIKELYGISSQTLYNWRKNNVIEFERINSRKIMYGDLKKNSSQFKSRNKRLNVIYARVSNSKQKPDLERQIQVLSDYMASNGVKIDKIYSDIGSGMNSNRKEFNNLISDALKNKIDKIFISYKDRLVRFGFETIESIFDKLDTKIEIINSTREEDFQEELTQDLISIIHHFSMKLYSNRRKELKNLNKNLKSKV